MLGSEPRLLLLDEPFSALDSFLRWELEQTVAEVIAAHGGTTLFVSHNRDEAYRLCSRIAVMEQGSIEVCKERQALFAAPETRAAARLTGCENIADIQPPENGTAFVPAWKVRVPVRGNGPAVGVPASALRPGEDFSAQVERVLPCPEDALVLVRPADAAQTLCWRTDTATAGQLSPGDIVRLCFDPQAIFLLR